MLKSKIYNQTGDQTGEIELSSKIFGVKVSESLVHQVLVAQTANQRQVLAHTKGRSDVRGGGRKPWKQKGTGRARQGSIRAPQWIGGGVVFGPLKSRNFSQKVNKKMKQKALFMVLSDKLSNEHLIILEKLEIPEIKTKIFNEMLNNLENKIFKIETAKKEKNGKIRRKRSVLIVNDKKNENIKYAGRNLVGAEIINLDNINLMDLLKYRDIVITVEAVKKIEEKYK